MRIRELNIKKINLNEIDKTYPGQDILFKCGELYQFESGIYGYGNLITKMERYVENIIIEECFCAVLAESLNDYRNFIDLH